MKTQSWLLIGLLLASTGTALSDDDAHRIGAGVNYWTAIDDIDVDNIDDDGFSYLVSYRYHPGLLGLQLDAELLPDRFGEDAVAPAAYVILGRAIYVGAGAGIVYADSEWADDPFFALKAGLDLQLIGSLYLDISASFRFDSEQAVEDAVDDIDTDTVFLGAVARIGF